MKQISALPKLFEPLQIRSVELKNRTVMTAMGTHLAEKGRMTQRPIDYYVARAKGGIGLIIAEAMPIHPFGLAGASLPCIYDDRFIPGLKILVDAVQEQGARICAQLLFAGTPQTTGIHQTPAPNDIGARGRGLSVGEIELITKAYGEAAARARAAGFDMVEVHCAHGTLPCLFLSPYYNRRTDEYGGELGRTKFAVDILSAIREKAGDFPVLFRINGDDGVGERGVTVEVAIANAKRLEEAGADAIDVSSGMEFRDAYNMFPPMTISTEYRWRLAEAIKKALSIPVIISGGITDPRVAEDMLQSGKADLVGFARPLLADPELPRKAKEGRFDDIRPCIRCNQGCQGNLQVGREISCLSNPEVAHEKEWIIKPAEKSKKVLVIGGGPAGMEASVIAAQRGHKVILYEKGEKLGGQLRLAAIPPGKAEINKLIGYLETQLSKLKVKVELAKEATAQVIGTIKPDVIILASGGVPCVPSIPGVNGKNVVIAVDVLDGKARVGNKVIIIGGGMVGCEVADFLSTQGKEVTVVEILDEACWGMEGISKAVLLKKLNENQVKIVTGTVVKEITAEGIVTLKGPFGIPPEEKLEGDTIVMATGVSGTEKNFEHLKDKAAEFYVIGDSLEPGTALDAIHQGFHVARAI